MTYLHENTKRLMRTRERTLTVHVADHALQSGQCLREAAKKVPFLVARPLRGGGGRSWPLRKKNFFWSSGNMSSKNVATKLEGGGGGGWAKALVSAH